MAKPKAKKVPQPPWNPTTAEIDAVARVLNATWQAVGSDTLSCARVDRLDRAEVFDAVADYVDVYGRDPLGIKLFGQPGVFDYVAKHLERFFPHRFYGL